MNTVFIYTISDPVTGAVRYVGKSKNPKRRFIHHMHGFRNERSHKTNWIQKLKKQGLKPLFEIIDEVPEVEWHFWEKYWIEQIRTWGFSLLNHTSGGDGLTHGNQTSFKKGLIPWNKGLIKIGPKKPPRGKSHNSVVNQFPAGNEPWNKGKSNYKLGGKKASRPVLQYDLNGVFIKEHLGCKEAAGELGITQEPIRLCCVGKSKTSKGFIFKYKTI